MDPIKFSKHQHLYIDNSFFQEFVARCGLSTPQLQEQFFEDYTNLLIQFGGHVRRIAKHQAKSTYSNSESLYEIITSSSAHISLNTLLSETELVKDKYSCVTPTFFILVLFSAYRGTVSLSQTCDNSEIAALFERCVSLIAVDHSQQLQLTA